MVSPYQPAKKRKANKLTRWNIRGNQEGAGAYKQEEGQIRREEGHKHVNNRTTGKKIETKNSKESMRSNI